MTSHIERVEDVNAERAALPKEERVRREAADAPLLRIQLAYALERAEKAEAKTGPTDALEQRLAAMEKLAAAWQKEAEQARRDCASPAYADDAVEFVVWSAMDRNLDEVDVRLILKTIRNCRHLAAEAIHIAADSYKAAEERVRALHAPVQHLGKTWCAECSVRRRTGPRTDEWVALIPHPCPTIEALEDKEPST